MDFDEFEQLVLKVLFETDVPVTAAHVAYLGRVSVRTAERHLARMVEHGTLLVQTSTAGVVEYIYPGRKPLTQSAGAGPGFSMVGPPPISAGDAYFMTLRPKSNPVTAGSCWLDAHPPARDTSMRAAPAPASPGWRRRSWATLAASCRASSFTASASSAPRRLVSSS